MLKEFYIGQYHIEHRGSQLVNFSFLDLVVFDMVLETCLLGVVSLDLPSSSLGYHSKSLNLLFYSWTSQCAFWATLMRMSTWWHCLPTTYQLKLLRLVVCLTVLLSSLMISFLLMYIYGSLSIDNGWCITRNKQDLHMILGLVRIGLNRTAVDQREGFL